MASSDNWQDQLLSLRALTATTGVIHEAQALQLKMWGAIAFEPYGRGSWTCIPDAETKTVLYTITVKQRVGHRKLAPYVAGLVRSVKWLFGEDWAVNIEQNGKLIYEGERSTPDINAERKSRTGNRAD